MDNKTAIIIDKNIQYSDKRDYDILLYKVIKDNKEYYYISDYKISSLYGIDLSNPKLCKSYIERIYLFEKDIDIKFDEDDYYVYNINSIINDDDFVLLDDYIYIVREHIHNGLFEKKYHIYIYNKDITLEEIINNHKRYCKWNEIEFEIYKLDKDKLTFLHKDYLVYREVIDKKYERYKIDLFIKIIPYGKWEYQISINDNIMKKVLDTDYRLYERYLNYIYSDVEFLQIFFKKELDKAIDSYNSYILDELF